MAIIYSKKMGDPLLSHDVKYFAGKGSSSQEDQWLPLWMHLRDTGEMMKRLIQNWAPESFRRTLGLSEEAAVQTAYFLGAVHDLGKASALFQARILLQLPEARERVTAVVALPDSFPSGKHTPHARAGEAILLAMHCPEGVASVVGAHHGKPQQDQLEDYIDEQLDIYPGNYWGKGQKARWMAVWQVLIDDALKQAALPSLEALPVLTLPQELLLTGLLIMADWIASNTAYFPLIPIDEMGDDALYPRRVDDAWSKLALTFPWESWCQWMDDQVFSERFGFQPNELQRAVLSVVNNMQKPGLLIIEAQMGGGKTEAALAAAEVLAAKFGLGGLYFGLPTQATANGIFDRLASWAGSQSEDMAQSIRLAHGMAALNEDYQALMRGASVVEEDNPDNGILVHQWFQGNKQALLADFVIGTVDQFLMAGLQQKHLMLRHLGLVGKVVVVDEVHAYDAYMNHYFDRVLQWLGTYGVPVILLSATLPAARRRELAHHYLNTEAANETLSQSDDYPLLTWTEGSQVSQQAVALSAPRRSVALRYEKESDLPEVLRSALQEGGCAGVICNTVKKAQALARVLRAQLPECEIMLFHAQFLMPDRAEKEQVLLKRLGKRSTAAQRDRLIVVGTQVLEQSLDVDFDFLVSESCPMDLLLQRIGREHRHQGRVRPSLLSDAACVILQPDDGGFDAGSKAVYGEWLLWRTNQLLKQQIVLPDDIPRLVQAAYQWDEKDVLGNDDRCAAMRQAYELLQEKKKQRANAYVIPGPQDRPLTLGDEMLDNWINADMGPSEATARAAVRDGDPSLEVLVMVKRNDGRVHFLPWQEDGRAVPVDRPPAYEESLCIARQRLRLPAFFSKRWTMDQAIEELETVNREELSEWQRSPLLKGELVLLLDEGLSASLIGSTLHYDREEGLTVKEGDTDGTHSI